MPLTSGRGITENSGAISSDGKTITDFTGVTKKQIPPTADFIANRTNINAGDTVTFTDLSTGSPTSWSWNFGDNGTSAQKNPSHVYSAEGTFTVTLTATNIGGSAVKARSNYITVGPSGEDA